MEGNDKSSCILGRGKGNKCFIYFHLHLQTNQPNWYYRDKAKYKTSFTNTLSNKQVRGCGKTAKGRGNQ